MFQDFLHILLHQEVLHLVFGLIRVDQIIHCLFLLRYGLVQEFLHLLSITHLVFGHLLVFLRIPLQDRLLKFGRDRVNLTKLYLLHLLILLDLLDSFLSSGVLNMDGC
jgi:hypothetical protein